MKKYMNKCFNDVSKFLGQFGVRGDDIDIKTLTRGPDHLIVLKGDVIGDYNHRSRIIRIYKDVPIVAGCKEKDGPVVEFKL